METFDSDSIDAFSPEQDWSSVYIDVVNKLRENKNGQSKFEQWLRKRSRRPSDLDFPAYCRMRGWDERHHAVQIVNAAAQDAAATVGLLLAIRTPKPNETLRLAFPLSTKDVGDYRVLFPLRELGSEWFPDRQRLRHQHAQINFSDRFGPKGGEEICAGMLWCSMVSNKPLYCGDVTYLQTDHLGEALGSEEHGIRRFRSVGAEQEKFLGMSSILYIPIHSGNGDPSADLVLGLYSPLPFVFGTHRDFAGANGYCDPQNRFCQAQSPDDWLDDFTSRFLLSKILPTLLINIDKAYRRGMYDCIEIVNLSHKKVESIVKALRAEVVNVRDEWKERAESVVEQLMQAVEREDQKDDPHHRILALYRLARTNSAYLSGRPLVSVDINVIYRYLYNQNDELITCGADDRSLFFKSFHGEPQADVKGDVKYLEKNKVAVAVASILNGYIKNARNAGSKLIVVDHEVKDNRIIFSITNKVAYSEERVRQYWVVRQGHIARGNKTNQQSGTHGLTLYLTRQISHYLNIECEFLMSVPDLESDECDWLSTVSAPFKEEG